MNSQKSYNTKQKSEILNFLIKNSGKHFTADEIVSNMSSTGINVGKSTVYRFLEKLTTEQRVRKYEISKNDSACYEYTGNENNSHCMSHYHLKCTSCDRLFHINCHTLNSINEHILRDHYFTVDNTKTVLYGTCKDCLKEDLK